MTIPRIDKTIPPSDKTHKTGSTPPECYLLSISTTTCQ